MNATKQHQETKAFTIKEQFFKANIFNLHLQPRVMKRKLVYITHHDMTFQR